MRRIVNPAYGFRGANGMRMGGPRETMGGYESGPVSAVTDRGLRPPTAEGEVIA